MTTHIVKKHNRVRHSRVVGKNEDGTPKIETKVYGAGAELELEDDEAERIAHAVEPKPLEEEQPNEDAASSTVDAGGTPPARGGGPQRRNGGRK